MQSLQDKALKNTDTSRKCFTFYTFMLFIHLCEVCFLVGNYCFILVPRTQWQKLHGVWASLSVLYILCMSILYVLMCIKLRTASWLCVLGFAPNSVCFSVGRSQGQDTRRSESNRLLQRAKWERPHKCRTGQEDWAGTQQLHKELLCANIAY